MCAHARRLARVLDRLHVLECWHVLALAGTCWRWLSHARMLTRAGTGWHVLECLHVLECWPHARAHSPRNDFKFQLFPKCSLVLWKECAIGRVPGVV